MADVSNVSIVSAKDTKRGLDDHLKRAVGLLGGFSKFIRKGDRVLIKPNFNSDDPFPASSDPAFVQAAIVLIREAGAKEVVIGESSGPFWKPTRKVMKNTGMAAVAEKLGVEIRYFDELDYVYKEIPGAKHLKGVSMTTEIGKYDRLVYLCCMKTHTNARFTLSLKLAMGFPKTADRLKMHMHDLEEKIAELNLLMKPDLIIMDGRKCFVTGGPASGTVEEPGVILASKDRVAIDVEAINILQSYNARNQLNKPPLELPMIKRAIDIGIGKPGKLVKK
jgi:uncharacterized protein (DUF362 family)